MKYYVTQLKHGFIFDNPRCGWMLFCPKCGKVLSSGSPDVSMPFWHFCNCDKKDGIK